MSFLLSFLELSSDKSRIEIIIASWCYHIVTQTTKPKRLLNNLNDIFLINSHYCISWISLSASRKTIAKHRKDALQRLVVNMCYCFRHIIVIHYSWTRTHKRVRQIKYWDSLWLLQRATSIRDWPGANVMTWIKVHIGSHYCTQTRPAVV